MDEVPRTPRCRCQHVVLRYLDLEGKCSSPDRSIFLQIELKNKQGIRKNQ